MIQKVVRRRRLSELDSRREDLTFWLSRPPQERIAAVECWRRQWYGTAPRLQSVARVVNAHGVEYLVVGGYALAWHGAPHLTGDLDLWIKADQENAQRLLTALAAFGFGSLGLTADDFLQEDMVVQLGYPPVRIDLHTSLAGVAWPEAWRQRTIGTCSGVSIPFIGRDDLIANKRAVGRKQDLADLEALGAS